MARSPGRRSVLIRSAGARHLIPDDEGARSQQRAVNHAEQMSAYVKEILNGSVHREKSLRVGSGLEATHRAFPFPSWLVGYFPPIVPVLGGAMNHGRHCGAEPRGATAQFVRDQSSRDTALSFERRADGAYGRPPIAPGLHEDIDDVAVVVDGPPQKLGPALEFHEDLVQTPRVAHATPAAPQPTSVVESERPTPLANRLIRHGAPAFGKEILEARETQAETVIEPDGMADNLGRKAMPQVAGSASVHPGIVPGGELT